MGRNASGGGGSRARAAAANLGAISARAQARGRSSASAFENRRAMTRRRATESPWDDNYSLRFSGRVVRPYGRNPGRATSAGFTTRRFDRRAGQNRTVTTNTVRNRRGQFNLGRNRQLRAGQMTFLDF